MIQDADGGVLPGVTVTIENEGTGVFADCRFANAVGEYNFANVQPGTYTLRAELSGFAPFRERRAHRGCFLVPGGGSPPSTIGGIEETVTVIGETPLIETATASVSSAVSRAELEVLPTPGRNVFILGVGTPNVVHTGNPVWVKQSDQTNSSLLSLGGGPLRGNNYTVDGVSTTDLRNRTVIIPVFEAVQETEGPGQHLRRRDGPHRRRRVQRDPPQRHEQLGRQRPLPASSGEGEHVPGAPSPTRTSWRTTPTTRGRSPTVPSGSGEGPSAAPSCRDRTFFWLSAEGNNDVLAENTEVILPSCRRGRQVISRRAARRSTTRSISMRTATAGRSPGNRDSLAHMIDPAGARVGATADDARSGRRRRVSSGAQTTTALQSTGNLSHIRSPTPGRPR